MSTVSVSVPVPISGFGPVVDVSALVGEKTVLLSGKYSGAYVLYGSHDGSNFAPLLIFNAGGIEGIRQTIRGAFSQMRLKSLASRPSGVSLNVSGASSPGDNSFASLSGGVLDLGDDAYQTDLNFMGFGQVNGAVVVEGSLDGVGWNPIGEFASSASGTSLLGGGSGIEFSPISCPDRVRYVQLGFQGVVGGFMVTVGGAKSSASGGVETLAAAYAAGVTSVDQILVLDDAKGGSVVFDGGQAGFTGYAPVQILSASGSRYAGLSIGPDNVGITLETFTGTFMGGPTSLRNTGVGYNPVVWGGSDNVVLGASSCMGDECVSVGNNSYATDGSVALAGGTAWGLADIAIGPGSSIDRHDYAMAFGPGATVTDDHGMAFGEGSSAGLGEVVFSSASAGGVTRFGVVSSVVGNPDLYAFDGSLVGSANTTSFILLVTKDDGVTTVALPVTLSAPDPVTHMSTLQVFNN
jgi:hypothetical protein